MIDLNRKLTIKKNRIDRKIGQKKIDVLINRWSIFYLRIILFLSSSPVESNSNLQNYPDLVTGEGKITELRQPKINQKINYRKMKRLIIYDRKSMIGSKKQFLKTDQSIMIKNQFLIGTIRSKRKKFLVGHCFLQIFIINH